MQPGQREQVQVWQILKDAPLVQKWPQFHSQVLSRADLREYRPGEFVFRRGDPPLYLFVVVAGQVLMRLQEGGEAWFEQELKPGQFFGQQALWDETYRATARVPVRGESAWVLLITANDLRVALEREPELREELLHEARAGRVRRIPLFRDLTDDQIRWVAQLLEERELRAGDPLDLPNQPGVWIVDRGQIAVTGDPNPYPNEWRQWRITAGNFFVSMGNPGEVMQPGKTMRFGASCAADSATANVDSHLFYLAAEHADRLITQFPDVGSLVHQPLDILAAFEASPLLKALSRRQRQHLAHFTGWEFVPEKQNITTQGNTGHTYVILRQGGALITAFDNYGRERPRSRLKSPAAYGETSLLEGKPRDVTVRAVTGEGSHNTPGLAGADILTVDRRDFARAVAESPNLWKDTGLGQQLAEKQDAKSEFAWMQEGEVVKWSGRPHRLWLFWPLAALILLFLVLIVVVAILPPAVAAAGEIALTIIGAVLFLPAGIFIIINYFDDYYVITNRRITRRDRQLIFFEARAEAPVEMVQDITINSGFWGRVFDYGDVTVRTASKTGLIRLANVARPYAIKELLEETRTEAQTNERGRQKEELRRGLIKDLHLALPVPQRQRALGDAPTTGSSETPSWFGRIFRPRGDRVPTPPSTRAWLARRASVLPDSWRKTLVGQTPGGPATELLGMIIWRKHWLNGLRRAGPPFLVFLLALVLGLFLLTTSLGPISVRGFGYVLGWLVLLAGAGLWLWWEFTDYRNDVYVVTDDRIIDIEMQPWGLNAKRREGGLEKVQNVLAKQNGIWAKVFQYGDVVITTAASDEGFTFNMVPQPQLVQSTVFQKLNQFRARDERRRATQRQQELVEALSVYHQLRGGGPQADSFS